LVNNKDIRDSWRTDTSPSRRTHFLTNPNKSYKQNNGNDDTSKSENKPKTGIGVSGTGGRFVNGDVGFDNGRNWAANESGVLGIEIRVEEGLLEHLIGVIDLEGDGDWIRHGSSSVVDSDVSDVWFIEVNSGLSQDEEIRELAGEVLDALAQYFSENSAQKFDDAGEIELQVITVAAAAAIQVGAVSQGGVSGLFELGRDSLLANDGRGVKVFWRDDDAVVVEILDVRNVDWVSVPRQTRSIGQSGNIEEERIVVTVAAKQIAANRTRH